MKEPLPVDVVALSLAASLLVVHGGVSIVLRLGLARRMAVAAVRAVVQLLLLGYVLVPVFALDSPWPVVALLVAMTVMAAREATRRVGRRYRGVRLDVLAALALAATVTAVAGTAVVLRVEPWWSPRYLVPLAGMILGNALTGVSVGLDRTLAAMHDGQDRIELWLALGATRWEAVRPLVADGLRAGMIPILNTMSAVGIVSIPGMMTGQILGGTPPALAARYQILILFLIAAATAIGCTVAVLLSVPRLLDRHHRLRIERLGEPG